MLAFGVHEDWTATPPGRTPSEILVDFPKASLGRCFTGDPPTTVQDLRPKAKAVLDPYLKAGTKRIYLSVKSPITQTRNGEWNFRYRELGAYLAWVQEEFDVEIVLIPWHEPEDNFSNALAFVHYYNKVYDNVKLGSSLIKVKPCFGSYHWAPGPTGSMKGKTDNPEQWFSGLKMHDGVTIDVYSGRSFRLDAILPNHPGFARFVQYAPFDVDIDITERGFETPSATDQTERYPLRADTARREFDWLLSPDPVAQRIKAYNIWLSPGRENAVGLITDPLLEEQIHQFLRRLFPETPAELKPDVTDPQYLFGYQAGLAMGRHLGRKLAFGEARDWAASQIVTDKEVDQCP